MQLPGGRVKANLLLVLQPLLPLHQSALSRCVLTPFSRWPEMGQVGWVVFLGACWYTSLPPASTLEDQDAG